jgi:putative FmdB family regulatory protein
MPIYEFHCASCGKDSEVLVRSSEWKGTTCPHCGSKKLDKKFSVFASSGASDDAGGACAMPSGKGGGGCGCCCGGGPHRH